MRQKRPLVLHLLFRLDTGGLEQVLLDTVCGLSNDFRHVIVSLTDASSAMRAELPDNVEVYELGKQHGQDPTVWLTAYRLFRRLRPDILQSYNIACLEFQVLAFLARVPFRMHAEHGRSAADPNGTNPKHRWLRRRMRLFVHVWVTVSGDLYNWLCNDIGVPETNVVLVYNGVDINRYSNVSRDSLPDDILSLYDFCSPQAFVVGTIGRLDPVKNHEGLIKAWSMLMSVACANEQDWVLVIVGGGALDQQLRRVIEAQGMENRIWMAGEHTDVTGLLARFDLFVLPSIAEGLPMTLLEAMASAKPVIATSVGGIPELITVDTGTLVKSGDDNALMHALLDWGRDEKRRRAAGNAARERVVQRFGLDLMLNAYAKLYANGLDIALDFKSQQRS